MKIMLFANTEWYLFNFRRSLAQALVDAGHEVLLVSPPGPYGERLRALGFNWLPAPMDRRSLNPRRELPLLWWLRGLMVRERVDLVHGFTIKCALYGSLAARWAGVPRRVNAVTGLGYVFSSQDVKARLLRPGLRLALGLVLGGRGTRLILQNPDDVALFQQAGLVDPALVRLIPSSGVDCARFVPDGPSSLSVLTTSDASLLPVPSRGPPPPLAGEGRGEGGPSRTQLDDLPRALLPARLLWDKGLAELVAAARQLRDEGRPVRVLLAGTPDPGNPAAVPEATVRGWEAEGLVEWLGHVEDMPALYRSVDLVVLPSYREGLPKGLIEAAACGRPLVTTDVPGCREVVTDGVEGLLVPARDAPALAVAIGRLAADPALRARMGAAARAKAVARFDERIVIRETLAVYGELLAG